MWLKRSLLLLLVSSFLFLCACNTAGATSLAEGSTPESSSAAPREADNSPVAPSAPAPDSNGQAGTLAEAIATQLPLNLAAGEVLVDPAVNLWAPVGDLPNDRFDANAPKGEWAESPAHQFLDITFTAVDYMYDFRQDHLKMLVYEGEMDAETFELLLQLFTVAYEAPVHHEYGELGETDTYYWGSIWPADTASETNGEPRVEVKLEFSKVRSAVSVSFHVIPES